MSTSHRFPIAHTDAETLTITLQVSPAQQLQFVIDNPVHFDELKAQGYMDVQVKEPTQ